MLKALSHDKKRYFTPLMLLVQPALGCYLLLTMIKISRAEMTV